MKELVIRYIKSVLAKDPITEKGWMPEHIRYHSRYFGETEIQNMTVTHNNSYTYVTLTDTEGCGLIGFTDNIESNTDEMTMHTEEQVEFEGQTWTVYYL